MHEGIRVGVARAAVGIAVVAVVFAFALWIGSIRAGIPSGVVGVMAAFALWSPIALVALYTVVSQTPDGRLPIDLGPRAGDAWVLVSALCIFALGFWRDLLTFVTGPFPFASSSGRMFEFIAFGALISRLVILQRHRARLLRPGEPIG